jgi:hypothetical protein
MSLCRYIGQAQEFLCDAGEITCFLPRLGWAERLVA